MFYHAITICFLFVGTICFSQDLEGLLKQKDSLAQLNLSSTDIDREISQMGILPDAFIFQFTQTSQEKSFQFDSYKPISSEKESIYENRFKILFPEISEIKINNQHIKLVVPNTISDERINEIFRVFGYKQFKLKKS